MILEIIFFVCLLIGFVNARSIQIADRSLHGRYYIIFPSSKILIASFGQLPMKDMKEILRKIEKIKDLASGICMKIK